MSNDHNQHQNAVDAGGPAFPTPGYELEAEGMTLRDYFAIHATYEDIAPFIVTWVAQVAESNGGPTRLVAREQKTPTTVARYAFADAMLKARELK